MRLRVIYRVDVQVSFLKSKEEIRKAFLINISDRYAGGRTAYLMDDCGKIFEINPSQIIKGEWVK